MKKISIEHSSLLIMVLLITLGHYLTPTEWYQAHSVYQRLYYVPLVFAAYWLRFPWVLFYAFLVSLAYIPHLVLHWGHFPESRFNKFVEIAMFFLLSGLIGLLFQSLKRQQRLLLKQQIELEKTRRLSLLGKLASGLAHEIRNPLNSLIGSSEIVSDALGADHPQQEFAAILKSELQRVTRKLNQFLNYARPSKPDKIPNQILDVVQAVKTSIEPQARKKNITIMVESSGNIPLWPMDSDQVHQILLNLGLNALEYSPENSIITFNIKVSEQKMIVEVKDQGPGIPQDEVDKVFEPFYSTRNTGTGLGLAISRQLAEGLGGNLQLIHSEDGAVFLLELPEKSPATNDRSTKKGTNAIV